MKTLFARLTLRTLAVLDIFWLRVKALKKRGVAPVLTAGAGVQSAEAIPFRAFGDVDWPEFPTLAHGFWRAQELTLFREHRFLFAEPVLDLGCGDCLFGRMAGFPSKGYGLDYDEASLDAARRLGTSLELIRGDAGQMSLPDQCVASCVSNSVLEHLPDLRRCFKEVHRVLKPGGPFIFTMTLGSFTDHLRFWTGRGDAAYWVRTYGHLQQPSEREVLDLLRSAGFEVRESISYQSRRMTARYRLLVSPLMQFLGRHVGGGLRSKLQERLASQVRVSLRQTQPGDGACLFVVAARGDR